jgi:hypothetical protein
MDAKGFKIQTDGTAYFYDVIVRGKIESAVLQYDKISAVGGGLISVKQPF